MTYFVDDKERREAAAGFEDVFERLTAATSAELDGAPAASSTPDPAQLFSGLEGQLEAERGVGAWLRSRPTMQRVGLALAAIATAIVLGLLKRRVDFPVYPKLRLALELAAPLLLIGLALRAWLRPLHKPAPRFDVTPWLLGVVLLLPVVQALLPVAHQAAGAMGGMGMKMGHGLLRGAIGCLLWGLALGLPAALLVRALGRGGGRSAGRSAVLAAAIGGLAGFVALHLHCPSTDVGHLLLAHAPIPALAALLGAVVSLLGRRPALRNG